ncbi:MAG: ABC transporter substrate-binding protein [Candidatus Accumulibacter sp.]|jgi:iron complex transport system substrate-binding protein|nr:ABC transporter substrate-binding protein [Accumulibacter sp.]
MKKEFFSKFFAAAVVAVLGLQAAPSSANQVETPSPGRPGRVVTLVIPAASMVIALDRGPERLIGIHPASRPEITDGILGCFFPAAKQIRADMTGEGFAPNVEALLASRPDLVVQWGDRGRAIVDPIVRAGLPVLTLHSDGGGELAAGWLRLLGRGLVDREARGEALAERFLAARDAIVKTVAEIPESLRPKAVYLYRRQGNVFQVAGKKTTVDSDIRLAGGVNPASHLPGYAQVSVEQLLAWAPDIVLLGNFDKDLRPASLFGDPVFASLPAVREKRVYLYPRGGFRWDPPSHETPLAWRWLLTLFHPDRPSASLRAEMTESYRRLYNRAPTDMEINTILRMIDNNESLYYHRKFSR